jgi:alpha-galactosidase
MRAHRTIKARFVVVGIGLLAAALVTPASQALAHGNGHGSGSGSGSGKTSPSYNGLALTPPMGFNDWNAFGCNVSQALVEQTALAMHRNGMQAAGYDYVNIDDCWMQGRDVTGAAAKIAAGRDAGGHLIADPTYFPDGIAALAKYVHSLGLKLGIYEDIGTATCQGLAGSYGHEATDAKDFAKWGVDYLKYDDCNLPSQIAPTPAGYEAAYQVMSNALKATGRPIVYSICEHTEAGASWLWGATQSNLWRSTSDIRANFASMVTNFTKNSVLAQYAGPGHWNDPDMLEIGTGKMTNLAAPVQPGDSTIKVDSVTSAIVGSPITVGTTTGGDLESGTVASVGTAATNTTLFSDAAAGASNVKVASVVGFNVGDPITVDGTQPATISSVGTAGAKSTLFSDAAVGATTVKLASVAGATVGQPISIDTGGTTETPTVTAVGTAATATTLAAASAVGDANLKVTSVTNIDPGDTLAVDTGANAETVTVSSVGTAGATGTGLTVSPALTKAHSGGFRGAALSDLSKPGTGVTFTPALTSAHPAGAATATAGTGISFAPSLATAHATGAIVVGTTGTGITLTAPLHRAHATGSAVGISGMTVPEGKSEMSLWAMEASPMIAGTDVVNMAPQNQAIYENRDVIAIDQDKLGSQAYVLSNANSQWVLVKQLADGSRAVAFFNAGSTPWTGGTVSVASLGLDASKTYPAKDLWSGTSHSISNTISVGSVDPHATVMLRIGKGH